MKIFIEFEFFIDNLIIYNDNIIKFIFINNSVKILCSNF